MYVCPLSRDIDIDIDIDIMEEENLIKKAVVY